MKQKKQNKTFPDGLQGQYDLTFEYITNEFNPEKRKNIQVRAMIKTYF